MKRDYKKLREEFNSILNSYSDDFLNDWFKNREQELHLSNIKFETYNSHKIPAELVDTNKYLFYLDVGLSRPPTNLKSKQKQKNDLDKLQGHFFCLNL